MNTTFPKYPHIKAQLTGEDGNAFSILAIVKKALEFGGVDAPEVAEFYQEACLGDYDHLIQTCMSWVDVS